jgi:hypothetical protein
LTTTEGASGAADAYAQNVLPPPSTELLGEIYQLTRQIRGYRRRDVRDEQLAERALALVVRRLRDFHLGEIDPPADRGRANALIAAADEWLSLASSICIRVYAPSSPSPRQLLKWSRKVAALLREICSTIELAISVAARELGASSWSVAASFPWGVSLALNFDTSLADNQEQEAAGHAETVEELQRQLAEARDALREAEAKIDRSTVLEMPDELRKAIAILNRNKAPSESEDH